MKSTVSNHFCLGLALMGGSFSGPLSATAQSPRAVTANADPQYESGPWRWGSPPLADCPFAASAEFRGIEFTGRHVSYTNADTWFPSWGADGNLYSAFADGTVGECAVSAKVQHTGYATIVGEDPLQLRIVDYGSIPSPSSPYKGRYPCGSLSYNGVWFYGTYGLSPGGGVINGGFTYNWPWLGAFVGFRSSSDRGRTWIEPPHTPERPIFGENGGLLGDPVKIGAPKFVDFGRNMENSPDGKAYLVAHGASDGKNRRFGFCSWITGDQVFVLRVSPTIADINDPSRYEFFSGADAQGQPQWTHDLSRIKPTAEWRDHMGCATATYIAPLRKYFLCVTDGMQTNSTGSPFNTYLLEAGNLAGPWHLVEYLKEFGPWAYFVNIPSKFISPDGMTFWICYAANFGKEHRNTPGSPPGSHYGMILREVHLLRPSLPKSQLPQT